MKIVTVSGNIVPLLGEFTPSLKDLATALSRIHRYTGHSKFTVAQHSVLVSRLVPQTGILPLASLLHDAHEGIVGDVSGPAKEAMKAIARQHGVIDAWSLLEESVAAQVRRYYGLPATLPIEVQRADKQAYGIEIAKCFTMEARKAFNALGYPPNFDGALDMESHPYSDRIWTEDEARIRFLARYRMLTPMESN